MDIPQVLAVLRPGEDWGPCAQTDSTYAELVAKWRGGSPVPTEAEMLAAWQGIQANAPAVAVAVLKAAALEFFQNQTDRIARVERAAALVVLDRVNELRAWLRDFKTAVAGAGTLAALKTAVAALPNLPDFTVDQVKTAFRNKINDPEAD